MKTELQHKKGTEDPKNHPESHFTAGKHDTSVENVFRLPVDQPSFLLIKNNLQN
jgi:hypothetical protein